MGVLKRRAKKVTIIFGGVGVLTFIFLGGNPLGCNRIC